MAASEKDDRASGDGVGLSDRQRRAAELLVSGLTISEVAREMRVNRSTVWRWNKEEEFAKHLWRLRSELLRATIIGMERLLQRSVRVVDRKLDEDSERAALGILRMNSEFVFEFWKIEADRKW